MGITQRDLAIAVEGLALLIKGMRDAADGEPIAGSKGKLVPSSVDGLRSGASFLEALKQDLKSLIDDAAQVVVPKEEEDEDDEEDDEEGTG